MVVKFDGDKDGDDDGKLNLTEVREEGVGRPGTEHHEKEDKVDGSEPEVDGAEPEVEVDGAETEVGVNMRSHRRLRGRRFESRGRGVR